RAAQRAAARAARPARDAQARRRAVFLDTARQQRRRLERRPLRGLPRPRVLAALPARRGLRRTGALLPPGRAADRAAALAGERLAQNGRMSHHEPAPASPASSRADEITKTVF